VGENQNQPFQPEGAPPAAGWGAGPWAATLRFRTSWQVYIALSWDAKMEILV
jgi:hypothetical protein